MSTEPSSDIDYRPGWRYLNVGLDDGSELRDEHILAFEQIVAHALGDDRYRLHRLDRWIIIAVQPPNADARMARLQDAFASVLGAYDDPSVANDICVN